MCKTATIKNRVTFYVQFWPIVAALISGFLYEIRTVDNLSVRIGMMEKQFSRMDDKLDKVLLYQGGGQKNVWQQSNGNEHDDKSALTVARN